MLSNENEQHILVRHPDVVKKGAEHFDKLPSLYIEHPFRRRISARRVVESYLGKK